jgi:hypothetical protein
MATAKFKKNDKFGVQSAIARLLFSAFLVFATYNPSGRSYWHWLQAGGPIGLQVIIGLVLLAGYVALLVATWEVIGFSGMFLTAAICLSVAFELFKLGLIDLQDEATFGLLVCVTLAVVIAFGMSFSFIFARLTGIVHTRGSIH